MNSFFFFLRTLFKRKWGVLSTSVLAAILAVFFVSKIPDRFRSSTVIYTGIISGFDILSSKTTTNAVYINGTLDNLISIIKSQPTLESVSLKLLAMDLMNLDPDNDNEYLTARSSRDLLERVPVEVLQLVDMDDYEKTVENLQEYASRDSYNFVYGLIHWHDSHYSLEALDQIKASRIGNSDMLQISYVGDDKYIVYHTLRILNEEFVNQYNILRFQQTNKVIEYFQEELDKQNRELTKQENALRDYNIKNLVINYEEQTRVIVERESDVNTRYVSALTAYRAAVSVRESLEEKLDDIQTYKNNALFLEKLRDVSTLYSSVSASSVDLSGSHEIDSSALKIVSDRKKMISSKTKELHDVMTDISNQKYTKEGLLSGDILDKWFNALLEESRAKAELEVLDATLKSIVDDYVRFSPIGTDLNRENRAISFSEKTYLSLLEALNEAVLRQKNLEMTSATFKVMTPPSIALKAEPSKNAMIVAVSFIVGFIFTLMIFIIIEIFNRRPSDKWQVEKLITKQIIGAYPKNTNEYFEIASENSIQQIGNTVINQFDRRKETNIINIFSSVEGVGKTTIMEALKKYFLDRGMKPFTLSWNKDFDAASKDFMMSFSIFDFAQGVEDPEELINSDVILIEYPPISQVNIPQRLVTECSANIFVVSADIVWTEMDQTLFKQLSLKASPELMICINNAENDVVGSYTGMLPPFNLIHKISFNINNLGVSSEKKDD